MNTPPQESPSGSAKPLVLLVDEIDTLQGDPLPFEEGFPGAAFVLAFRALPVILVVSALAALLTHWRILPLVIRGFGRFLERSFRAGGLVRLVSAANVLVGMIEAPLLGVPTCPFCPARNSSCWRSARRASWPGFWPPVSRARSPAS